ncbi:hypothetical protein KDL45_00780 [bacterium]|nr:hypothetical protein [bacterium]MCB9479110.1 hypothetical protein [Deltaproteobacteria bacterium]
MKELRWIVFALMLAMALTAGFACGGDDDDDDDSSGDDDFDVADPCEPITLDIDVCDPETGSFVSDIDNPYHPLPVGLHLVLEGDEDGTLVRVEIDVLDETKEVAGVTTRVVTETEYEDDELVEVSSNWFAQTSDGTVCYFGEEVDEYEDGEIVSHGGEWEAGVDGAKPGIIMPGDPTVGQTFYQELADGAQDMSQITALGEEFSAADETFTDTVTAMDSNPLEDCEADEKIYASGIGLVKDEDAELIEYTIP